MSGAPTFQDHVKTVGKILACDPLIRAVNFHNTPRAHAAKFDLQLANYSRHFSSVTEDELSQYLITGKWHKPKPGLIVAVYEGYRNGYDVLAPLLERHGFVGWYFIITGFVNCRIPDQSSFAQKHYIDMLTSEYPDGRYALTWEEIRKLERKHVIASHARTHSELSLMNPAAVKWEVVGSQEDFEKNLGRKVRSFVSLTGPPYGENRVADPLIKSAGYDFVFSNFRIQRIQAKLATA